MDEIETVDNLQVMVDQLEEDLANLRNWLQTDGWPLWEIEQQKQKIALLSAEITLVMARRMLNLP